MNKGVRKILPIDSWDYTDTLGKGKENKNATTSFDGLFACIFFWISQGISTIKHCYALFFLSLPFFCFVWSRMTGARARAREKTWFSRIILSNRRVTSTLNNEILSILWFIQVSYYTYVSVDDCWSLCTLLTTESIITQVQSSND